MNTENQYKLIHCGGCAVWPCNVSCKQNAIAFFCGNIMIEAAKCIACPDYAGELIPRCITGCKKGGVKQLFKDFSINQKRKNAAEALVVQAFMPGCQNKEYHN